MKKRKTFLLILAAAALVSAGLHIALTARYADWETADGVITDIRIHRSSGKSHRGSRYSYEIHYEYTVDGVSHSGVNAYSGRDTAHTVGEAVTVWYDPHHHADGSFHPPGPGLWPLVPFFIGVPLAIQILNKNKRGKRKYGAGNG